MEEKRDNQEEYKHVCKLCNKRYPSGKSLGGHMRSHVIANSYVSPNKLKSKKAPNYETKYNGDHLQTAIAAGGGGGGGGDLNGLGSSSYGLRENPKKTWRAEDSTTIIAKQERVCKQCGKAFQSLKALCGHMSCHSDKERKFSRLNGYDDDDDEEEEEEEDDDDEDELWESEEEGEEEKEVAMESHSDNVMGEGYKQRSGKEARYKAIAVVDSFSYGNGCSSNVSEIEHEQEEVAICLMMLSRDSGQKVAVNFTTESSDNNSVILEGGSASAYVTKKHYLNNTVSNDDKNSNGPVKMKQEASKEIKDVGMDNSDSGYFENGAKELESDDSVDWYARNYDFNKPKFKFGSRYVDVYDSEFSKVTKKSGNCYSEKAPYMVAEDEPEERDQAQLKRLLRSRDKSSNGYEGNDVYDRGSSKKTKHELLSSPRVPTKVSNHKPGKYECWICQRCFKTHQALGGHIITHRRDNNAPRNESARQSLESGSFAPKSASKPESSFVIKSSAAKNAANVSKKAKGHKCPFCPKVFRSGQALGGHKRSHLIGCSPQDRANLIQSVERKSPENNHQFLDLNLPAPVEEDGGGGSGGGHSQFMPW